MIKEFIKRVADWLSLLLVPQAPGCLHCGSAWTTTEPYLIVPGVVLFCTACWQQATHEVRLSACWRIWRDWYPHGNLADWARIREAIVVGRETSAT